MDYGWLLRGFWIWICWVGSEWTLTAIWVDSGSGYAGSILNGFWVDSGAECGVETHSNLDLDVDLDLDLDL